MTQDWSGIPVDLLRLIAARVHSIEDYVRFGAVCWSWHSATSPKKKNLKFLPWLMLAERENSELRGFYSLSSNKVVELELPEIRGRRCWGSPFGWLVTIGVGDDMEVHLFNPLSRTQISLPPRGALTNHHVDDPRFDHLPINKVVLSSTPPDCMVLAVYSCHRKLAFAKPGDHVWSPFGFEGTTGVADVAYFAGNFFVAKYTGELLICDLSGHDPVVVEFAPPPPEGLDGAKYLVELEGHLCMVFRYFHVETGANISIVTTSFKVFRLDMHTRTWEEISSLGDWSLFVGNNYSFCVPASCCSDCRSNCIYFTHDYCESYDTSVGNDMGVYNCEGGEIECLPVSLALNSLLCPPLWITPQF